MYACICPNICLRRTRKIFSPMRIHFARESRFICNRTTRLCLRASYTPIVKVSDGYIEIYTKVRAVGNYRLSLSICRSFEKFGVAKLSNDDNTFRLENETL